MIAFSITQQISSARITADISRASSSPQPVKVAHQTLQYLRRNYPTFTTAEIQSALGLANYEAEKLVRALVAQGVIHQESSRVLNTGKTEWRYAFLIKPQANG